MLGDHAACIDVIAIECCRERTGKHSSDQRIDVRETVKLFPAVDFSRIDPGPDIRHHPTEEEGRDAAVQRARGFFWNLLHPQNVIAVFTHGAFLYVSLAGALTMPVDYRKL